MAYYKKVTDEDIAKKHIQQMDTSALEETLKFLEQLKSLRSKDKLLSTYFTGANRALKNTGNGKIYFDYRLPGTVTGRLSCAAYNASLRQLTKKGKLSSVAKKYPLGLSFHTLPRDSADKQDSFRSVCVAPDDWYFITGDFKAAELRVLAHVSGDVNMIKAFKSGADPHRYTASLIYEKPVGEVTKEERQIAKSVSFLTVYGGGAWKLSRTANISLAAAEKVLERLKAVYPGVFIWMEHVKSFIYENRYAISMFNRRRNLPDILSKVDKVREKCLRQGVNFEIQSAASDIVCFSLLDIANELKFRDMRSKLAGSVHDSVEMFAPAEELEEVLQIMYNKMTNYPLLRSFGYNLKVDLECEFEVGRSFVGGTEVKFSPKGSVLNFEEVKNSIHKQAA